MTDRPEIRHSLATPPTRLRARRRDPVPALIAISVVAFVMVAVAKPWGAADQADSGLEDASPTLMADPSVPSVRGSPGTARRVASAPTDDIIRTIAGDLVGRSGRWGIGTGGPDASSDGAWVAWHPATPVSEDRSIGIRPPPSCPVSPAGSTRLRPGLVVALTVPAGLAPDWTAEAVRFDSRGRASFDGMTRQVTPPGNRGIAYLTRSDGSAWPAGAYRFRIATSTRSLSIDACLARA